MILSSIVLMVLTMSFSVKANASELPHSVNNKSLNHMGWFLCQFNENITFTLTDLKSNNETILAECVMVTKVCHLMPGVSETQFTVKYANPGGKLTMNNHSEDTNVSFTCYHSFNTTGQKDLLRYDMQHALRGNYNVSTDVDPDGGQSFIGGLSYTGTAVVVSLASVLVVAFIVGAALRASNAGSKRYRHVRS